MPSLLALLGGFGQGAQQVGSDLETRDLLRQQNQRMLANDALAKLVTLQKIGGVQLPQGVDPTQAVSQLTQANTLRSGGAIPNSALGISDASTPDAYGSPSTITLPNAQGQPMRILIDPSKTPEALQERRLSMTQDAMDRRQQRQLDAATSLESQREQAKTLAQVAAARADYNTLKAIKPNHPLVQAPFDPNTAANYSKALDFERDIAKANAAQPKNIDPLSPEGIAAGVKRAGLLAQFKPESPDATKAKTSEAIATPAANQLLSFYDAAGQGSNRHSTVGALSHVPMLGHYLEGKYDPTQQAADDAAVALATQYLEVMPKSRFQPSTIADVKKQIEWSPADSPQTRAQKRARIVELQKAIQMRAKMAGMASPDNSLDDAPLPPGVQP